MAILQAVASPGRPCWSRASPPDLRILVLGAEYWASPPSSRRLSGSRRPRQRHSSPAPRAQPFPAFLNPQLCFPFLLPFYWGVVAYWWCRRGFCVLAAPVARFRAPIFGAPSPAFCRCFACSGRCRTAKGRRPTCCASCGGAASFSSPAW